MWLRHLWCSVFSLSSWQNQVNESSMSQIQSTKTVKSLLTSLIATDTNEGHYIHTKFLSYCCGDMVATLLPVLLWEISSYHGERVEGRGGWYHKRFRRSITRTSYTMCSAYTTL